MEEGTDITVDKMQPGPWKRFFQYSIAEEESVREEMEFSAKKLKLELQVEQLKRELESRQRTIELLMDLAEDKDDELRKYPLELYLNYMALQKRISNEKMKQSNDVNTVNK